jgi:hypothetical protein
MRTLHVFIEAGGLLDLAFDDRYQYIGTLQWSALDDALRAVLPSGTKPADIIQWHVDAHILHLQLPDDPAQAEALIKAVEVWLAGHPHEVIVQPDNENPALVARLLTTSRCSRLMNMVTMS